MFKSKKIRSGKGANFRVNFADFLPKDHLCHLISSVVRQLDLTAIKESYSILGQNAYPPSTMLCILFYGYSQGIRSGQQLSDACKENIAFIYLSGGLRPSKSTINMFKSKHHLVFKSLFEQLVSQIISKGYTGTNEVFGDGTKIRANASVKRSKTKDKYEKWLSCLNEDIENLGKELINSNPDCEVKNQSKLKKKG